MIARSPRSPSASFRGTTRWLLLLIFVIIAATFVVTNVLVLYRAREIRRATQDIVENMLRSVELVGRMRLDVSRERRLIDEHILESETVGRARVEAEIAQSRDDFKRTAAAYGPLASEPEERIVWQRLQAAVDALDGPIAHALDLSRQDRDVEARAALRMMESQFQLISDDADALIGINGEQAQRHALQVTMMQRSGANFHTLLISIGVAATFIVGWWTIRLIGRREDQLTEYSAMLETRNRDLDAFAGRVAHDLRGPLSTINLAASRLSQQTPPAQEALLLQRGVHRMEALIRDLLALSRIDAEQSGFCDPKAVAAQVREDLVPRLSGEDATVLIDVEDAQVRCAEGLLRQTLWNLIDNAVKYRRPNAAVRVELTGTAKEQDYELRVSDNGAGLSADESQKAFEPFYRSPKAQKIPGTGLGLSIVKRIVEASGGTISVDSQPDHGTTFTIRLPLANGRQ
jgi:signal transduction histidine kinase